MFRKPTFIRSLPRVLSLVFMAGMIVSPLLLGCRTEDTRVEGAACGSEAQNRFLCDYNGEVAANSDRQVESWRAYRCVDSPEGWVWQHVETCEPRHACVLQLDGISYDCDRP